MTEQAQRWLAADVRTECTVVSVDPVRLIIDRGARDIDQRHFPKVGFGISRASETRQSRATPSSHTPAHKMSFLRVAFRGPAASFARNRIPASAAAIPRRTWLPQRAAFSAAAGLTKEDITTRVLDVLKGFEKVDPTKACNDKLTL